MNIALQLILLAIQATLACLMWALAIMVGLAVWHNHIRMAYRRLLSAQFVLSAAYALNYTYLTILRIAALNAHGQGAVVTWGQLATQASVLIGWVLVAASVKPAQKDIHE